MVEKLFYEILNGIIRVGNYFKNTLPALDRAYLRPRFPGYLHFQHHGGAPIRKYLMNGGNPQNTNS